MSTDQIQRINAALNQVNSYRTIRDELVGFGGKLAPSQTLSECERHVLAAFQLNKEISQMEDEEKTLEAINRLEMHIALADGLAEKLASEAKEAKQSFLDQRVEVLDAIGDGKSKAEVVSAFQEAAKKLHAHWLLVEKRYRLERYLAGLSNEQDGGTASAPDNIGLGFVKVKPYEPAFYKVYIDQFQKTITALANGMTSEDFHRKP